MAVLLVAILSLTFRASDEVGARIYGGPPGPDGTLSWRVVLFHHEYGLYKPVPHAEVELRLHSHPPQFIQGKTDSVGAWEVRFPAPTGIDEVLVSVVLSSGAKLLSHAIPIRPARWTTSLGNSPQMAGHTSGDLLIQLSIMRGVL
ncbi:MAG: hypothetical protein CSA75_00775, partial [Sorangium cellulosum]